MWLYNSNPPCWAMAQLARAVEYAQGRKTLSASVLNI